MPDPTTTDPTEAPRNRMIEEQLVARGVTDRRVLEAMRVVPRERFDPPDHCHEAHADRPLPIGAGQTISQPYVVAVMLEALFLGPGERGLEVGAGSGYAAAVLGLIVKEVHAVERHPVLARRARRRMAELRYDNVHVHHGDGTDGWPARAPFDAVIVSARGTAVPSPLLDQLAPSGRLVMPLENERGDQDLVLVRRTGDGAFERHLLGGVRFVPLVQGA